MACTALLSDQSSSTTKPYVGPQRKSKWVSKIKDPIKKRRLWLSTLAAAKVKSAAMKKRKRNKSISIVSSDEPSSYEESDQKSGNSLEAQQTLIRDNGETTNDIGTESLEGGVEEQEFSDDEILGPKIKGGPNDNFLVRWGPLIMDKGWIIVGEYSYLDDMTIGL